MKFGQILATFLETRDISPTDFLASYRDQKQACASRSSHEVVSEFRARAEEYERETGAMSDVQAYLTVVALIKLFKRHVDNQTLASTLKLQAPPRIVLPNVQCIGALAKV